MFFHISPVTQSHLPKSLARTVSVCNEDKATNSVALFAEHSSMVSPRRPSFENSKARGVDGRRLRLRKHHIAVFDTGHGAEHLGRNQLRVTFESWPCVKRVSRVGAVDTTSNENQPCEFATAWGKPRGAGWIQSRYNFPSKLLFSVIARSPLKAWMRTPGWLSAYNVNVRPFFVGKGGVAFNELCHDITCCLQTP